MNNPPATFSADDIAKMHKWDVAKLVTQAQDGAFRVVVAVTRGEWDLLCAQPVGARSADTLLAEEPRFSSCLFELEGSAGSHELMTAYYADVTDIALQIALLSSLTIRIVSPDGQSHLRIVTQDELLVPARDAIVAGLRLPTNYEDAGHTQNEATAASKPDRMLTNPFITAGFLAAESVDETLGADAIDEGTSVGVAAHVEPRGSSLTQARTSDAAPRNTPHLELTIAVLAELVGKHVTAHAPTRDGGAWNSASIARFVVDRSDMNIKAKTLENWFTKLKKKLPPQK